MTPLFSYMSGIVVLLILWILYRVLTGFWNPWKIVVGEDGRPSTSKLQFFSWTVVVIFSYIAAAAANDWKFMQDIPPNLLIAMGLSVTTLVVAKGITTSYVEGGKIVKTKADSVTETKTEPQATGPGAIFQDDNGIPDLSKIQMIAWTFIALLVFLIRLAEKVRNPGPGTELPDIDPILMILMGLGQTAYLGKKLVTTEAVDMPKLTGLSPGSGEPGTEVTLYGLSFGKKQDGSEITINDDPFKTQIDSDKWSDTQIRFKIPDKYPTGRDWDAKGESVSIGLIVGSQRSNTLPFTVSKAR